MISNSGDKPLMHPKYLPITESQLLEHFATTKGGRHPGEEKLKYYKSSLNNLARFEARQNIAKNERLKATTEGLQLEKDERFWVVATLLGAFYPAEERLDRVAQILRRALGDTPPFEGLASWGEALEGELSLHFEAALPSPKDYRKWLVENLDERNFVPHLLHLAKRAGPNPEGRTSVDAILVAKDTGVGVIFEAKVLSDVSTHISYDVMRNQIARNIDVMLENNDDLAHPLSSRDPDRTAFVLLTPRIFKDNPRSRLYGWLMNEYQGNPGALKRDLPHRRRTEWGSVSHRLGWLTYEDCKEVAPDSCSWLPGLT